MKQSDVQNSENIPIELNKSEEIKCNEKPIESEDNDNSSKSSENSLRRVSFPVNDNDLVTGYLEPANPWASGNF